MPSKIAPIRFEVLKSTYWGRLPRLAIARSEIFFSTTFAYFPTLSLSIFLCVHIHVCASVYLSLFVFFLYRPLSVSACMSVYLSIRLPICLYLSVHLYEIGRASCRER